MFIKSRRGQRGFTLIELLVVVAIISLLSSIVLAALKDARQKAKLNSISSEMTQLRTEVELLGNGEYYDSNTPAYCESRYGCEFISNKVFCEEGCENVWRIIDSIRSKANNTQNIIIYVSKNKWMFTVDTTSLGISSKRSLCIGDKGGIKQSSSLFNKWNDPWLYNNEEPCFAI